MESNYRYSCEEDNTYALNEQFRKIPQYKPVNIRPVRQHCKV